VHLRISQILSLRVHCTRLCGYRDQQLGTHAPAYSPDVSTLGAMLTVAHGTAATEVYYTITHHHMSPVLANKSRLENTLRGSRHMNATTYRIPVMKPYSLRTFSPP
jgi:hypothetical protein